MKIGPITRQQAVEINPDYVAFVEAPPGAPDYTAFDKIVELQDQLKRGDLVLTTAMKDRTQYIIAKVTSSKLTMLSEDGPTIRVSDGNYSWRADGNTFCVPVQPLAQNKV